MLSKAEIINHSLLMIRCKDYQFVFHSHWSLANMSEQKKGTYINRFFSVFEKLIFDKIRVEVATNRLQFDSTQMVIPSVIRRVAFVVLFYNDTIECKPVIMGNPPCELKPISIIKLWPGSKKIGEGSYGCIHAPSLMCRNSLDPALYAGKISKIMHTQHVRDEMRQNTKIDLIDPDNRYHVKSTYCTPHKDQHLLDSIDKCNNLDVGSANRYSLLIMDNGGIDLLHLCRNVDKVWTKTSICNMYVDALSLFKAVQVFKQNKFVHCDIKADNVVYNLSTREMKFIDFGLSNNSGFIENAIETGAYTIFTQFHYNIPPEYFLLQGRPTIYVYDKVEDDPKFSHLLDSITDTHVGHPVQRANFVAKSIYDFKRVVDSTEPLHIPTIVGATDAYGLGLAMHLMHYELPRLVGLDTFYAQLDLLLAKLMCMNYRERIDINSALTQYAQLLTLVHSAYTNRNVAMRLP